MTPSNTENKLILGPTMDPKMGQDGEIGARANQGGVKKLLAPRCPQDGSKWPFWGQVGPKLAKKVPR